MIFMENCGRYKIKSVTIDELRECKSFENNDEMIQLSKTINDTFIFFSSHI